jgi:magnesium-transporting ATPase (P-type)
MSSEPIFDNEKYQFEDNELNLLPPMSFAKKITFLGLILLILIIICYGFWYEMLILPGRRNSNTYFKGYALYALISSGIVGIFHFSVQIIGSGISNSVVNNKYFKYAYNSRILAIILLVIAFILSFVLYDSYGSSRFVDSKYQKEYIIY